ncbi:MAG: hypothetical protein U9N78_07545, partial [Actinomycetota bacterium]|nr:hypothetical protein [Actinomycetota bacterium]
SDQPPAASPTTETAAGGLTGAALLTAVAEARGMPESLVERSAKARARKTDTSLEDVLNEWAAEAGLVGVSPQTPDASPEGAATPAVEAAVAEVVQDDSQEPDEVAEPAPTQARSWHHAVAIGAITALVPLVVLVALAVFVDVPSDLTEAPWYLVGLDPFLTYLEPFIALVIIPGVALASGVVLAVVAWSPKVHPSTRRLALLVLVFLILTVGALTIVGAIQT